MFADALKTRQKKRRVKNENAIGSKELKLPRMCFNVSFDDKESEHGFKWRYFEYLLQLQVKLTRESVGVWN
jgi:hypothetical protein